MSPAVSTGYFRVLYYNPTLGVYQYASPNVPVVSGQASYSNPWTITQPVGTNWWVRVYYYSAGGTLIAQDNSNAAFTIF